MNQALLVYRFATAFQGAIKIMLRRICAAVLTLAVAGLLFCTGAARGESAAAVTVMHANNGAVAVNARSHGNHRPARAAVPHAARFVPAEKSINPI
jgi:hypothetical protein